MWTRSIGMAPFSRSTALGSTIDNDDGVPIFSTPAGACSKCLSSGQAHHPSSHQSLLSATPTPTDAPTAPRASLYSVI